MCIPCRLYFPSQREAGNYTYIEREEGLEMCVQVYGRCLSRSHNSIESHNFATLAKAAFVALEKDLVHL